MAFVAERLGVEVLQIPQLHRDLSPDPRPGVSGAGRAR